MMGVLLVLLPSCLLMGGPIRGLKGSRADVGRRRSRKLNEIALAWFLVGLQSLMILTLTIHYTAIQG